VHILNVCAAQYPTEEEESEMERDYEWEHNPPEYDDEGSNAEEQQERRAMRANQGNRTIAERVAERRRRNAP